MERVDQGGIRGRLRMPSPAMIVALVALFVGLTGGAFATASFKHGPKGIVNADDIALNTITWREIKRGTLRRTNFSRSTINALRGQRGPAGTNGTNGSNGTNGVNGTNGFGHLDYNADGPWVNSASSFSFGYALCDSGLYATGGGALPSSGADQYLIASGPSDSAGNYSGAGWGAVFGNSSTTTAHSFTVYVICANANQLSKANSTSGASILKGATEFRRKQ